VHCSDPEEKNVGWQANQTLLLRFADVANKAKKLRLSIAFLDAKGPNRIHDRNLSEAAGENDTIHLKISKISETDRRPENPMTAAQKRRAAKPAFRFKSRETRPSATPFVRNAILFQRKRK